MECSNDNESSNVIARRIADFQRDNGGLLSVEDMAEFRTRIEPPVSIKFGSVDVYGCGPWSQGPMLLQELALLDGLDLRGLGHNSSAYVHCLTEVIKLAAADREATTFGGLSGSPTRPPVRSRSGWASARSFSRSTSSCWAATPSAATR